VTLGIKATSEDDITAAIVFAAVSKAIKDINATDLHNFAASNVQTTDDGSVTADVTFDVRKDMADTDYVTASELEAHIYSEFESEIEDGVLTVDLTSTAGATEDADDVTVELKREYPTLMPSPVPTVGPTPFPSEAPTPSPSH
jgi:hypothetical protein